MDLLPSDWLAYIFTFLDIKSWYNILFVCKSWYKILTCRSDQYIKNRLIYWDLISNILLKKRFYLFDKEKLKGRNILFCTQCTQYFLDQSYSFSKLEFDSILLDKLLGPYFYTDNLKKSLKSKNSCIIYDMSFYEKSYVNNMIISLSQRTDYLKKTFIIHSYYQLMGKLSNFVSPFEYIILQIPSSPLILIYV